MNHFVGVHSVNSVDFVRTAFDIYRGDDILVVLKEGRVGVTLDREIVPAAGGGWLDLRHAAVRSDRPAQVVFSSGTEGAPKAILLTHAALADVVDRLNETMEVDGSIREYIGVPVTYSFGLGRCRAVAAAGGRSFIPGQGFNPAEIARMLAASEINAISAVPTLWRTLLSRPEVVGDLGRRVKWIEIGSQYMSRAEKEQMKQLFPNARIVQHYGLTEASRTTLLEIDREAGDRLDSVGRAVGRVEVNVSTDGLIRIRGPQVAAGQLLDGGIVPMTDADGWLTTKDLGRLEDGYLYFEGRADDVINCAGVKVNPETLQESINARLGERSRIAVARIDDALRGDAFFIAVESGAGVGIETIRAIAAEELQKLGIDARSAIKLQEVAGIPRTDTGKVRRKELSRLYIPDEPGRAHDGAPAGASSVRELFAHIFPGVAVGTDDTFRTLGGDSLNYVQMLMLLEKHLGFVPQDWDKTPVAGLEALERRRPHAFIGWLESSVFLRIAAIIGVVATHSGQVALSGGTLLLFMLIGYNLARFKSEQLASGNVWPWILRYLAVVLVPYYAFVLFYSLWNKLFHLDWLLLYTNLVEARILLVFPFWFVQVLVQCMVLLGIVFSLAPIRRLASRDPYRFSMIALGVLMLVRAVHPYFWDTKYLNDLVPLRFAAIIWLGWCFYQASTLVQRLSLTALGIAFAILDRGFSPVAIWLSAGSIVLGLVPAVPLPSRLKPLANAVGAATFHIFALNGLAIWAMEKYLGLQQPVMLFTLSMAICMAIWFAMKSLGEKYDFMARLGLGRAG